jgi:hypothetical protein
MEDGGWPTPRKVESDSPASAPNPTKSDQKKGKIPAPMPGLAGNEHGYVQTCNSIDSKSGGF